MTRLIQSAWALPGGNSRYLDTLVECLEWLITTPSATRDDMIQWFGERYNSAKSGPSYLTVLDNLGVIERDRGGRLEITTMGRRVVEGSTSERVDLVARRFLTGYVGFREILHLLAESGEPLPTREIIQRLQRHFPTWTSPYQFEFRLGWLSSLGLVERGNGRVYEIAEPGRRYAREFPPEIQPLTDERRPEPGGGSAPSSPFAAAPTDEGRLDATLSKTPASAPPSDPLEELLKELREAAVDSANPDRFETIIARVYEELGFSVTQLGESGETDVLVAAVIGEASYSVVVDAKSRHTGRVDQLEVLTLVGHKRASKADFAAVIAGGFGGGKVATQAREHGVVLLPVHVIEEWVRTHYQWPQSLESYRIMFSTGGLVERLPNELLRNIKVETRWSGLLSEVIELISEMYGFGSSEPMSPQQVYRLLVARLRGVQFPEHDVARAMEFLSHPALGALVEENGGYVLVMPRQSLGLRLRRLADGIENYGSENTGA
jgi:hypothetical protein